MFFTTANNHPVVPPDTRTASRDWSALLLVVYLYMFSVLRTTWALLGTNYSTIILAALACCILFLGIILRKGAVIGNTYVGAVCIVTIVYALLGVDLVFRYNDYVATRIYEFTIFGAIPITLMSGVRDFRKALAAYVGCSVVTFLLYVSDPFTGYFFSGGYMVFGYQAMLPAFFGLHVGRTVFQRRYLAVPESIAFVLIAIFGNRMAVVAAVMFVVIMDLNNRKRLLQPKMLLIAAFTIPIIFFINLRDCVLAVVNILSSQGLSSYALNKIVESDAVLSQRDVLWGDAVAMIREKPLLGWGVGRYESTFESYSHSIVTDILVSHGLIGALFLLIVIVTAVHRIVKCKSQYLRTFGLLAFCTAFPKLLASVHMYIEPGIWLFIYCGIVIPVCERLGRALPRYAPHQNVGTVMRPSVPKSSSVGSIVNVS